MLCGTQIIPPSRLLSSFFGPSSPLPAAASRIPPAFSNRPHWLLFPLGCRSYEKPSSSLPIPLLRISRSLDFYFRVEEGRRFVSGMGTNLISDDYDWINEVGGSDAEFRWTLDGFNDLPKACVEIDDGYKDVCDIEPTSSRKRARDDLLAGPKSKASREKLRREKLNDRFIELGSVLDPGRPIKSDKALILSDAARALVQLRNEAQQLKEANGKLQETIKDLKSEKNELRDEKIKLKADKERLELQLKAMAVPPPPPVGYMPHLAPLHAAAATAFAAQGQAASNKTTPFPGYPGIAMWQWMPPAMVDTSQDHKLRPPVA